MPKSCATCHWLEADQEDGNEGMGAHYIVCRGRSGVSNLKQFPFKKTNCADHRLKDRPQSAASGQ